METQKLWAGGASRVPCPAPGQVDAARPDKHPECDKSRNFITKGVDIGAAAVHIHAIE
jgi:hypothetical protein